MEQFVIFVLFLSIFVHELRCTCPFNWQLSDDGALCWINCDDPYRKDSLNVYCQSMSASGVRTLYNASTNVMSMSKGHSLSPPRHPPCFNVTLTKAQYNLTTSGFVRVADWYYRPLAFGGNDSVTLCVPPSPQLLQCETVVSHHYYYDTSASVVLPERNIRAYLGDFLIDSRGAVVTCVTNVTVSLYETPRCNYASVNPLDYVIMSNGSLFVSRANFLIKTPTYSLSIDDAIVLCFPLNFQFLNCSKKTSFPPKAYMFSRDMRVINLALFTTSALDSFYTGSESQLTQCPIGDIEGALSVSGRIAFILVAIGVLASGCLLATLVTHYSLFVQSNHTLCMLMHIVTMVCSNVTFIVHNFVQLHNERQSMMLFFWDYYFTVAASLWLNAISYDSWRYFKRMNATGNGSWKRSWVPFLCYNAYCWSVALLLAVVNVAADLGLRTCGNTFALCPHVVYFGWFNSVDAFLLYFCVPFNLMTFVNFVLLTWMVVIIFKAAEGTEMVNTQRKRQIFIITAKLFILSGFCYVIILVCNIINSIDNSMMMYTWFVESGSFISQGVAIFLIYFSKTEPNDSLPVRQPSAC